MNEVAPTSMAICCRMDKKAKEEGRQLDIEAYFYESF